jgi:hypothetical protein
VRPRMVSARSSVPVRCPTILLKVYPSVGRPSGDVRFEFAGNGRRIVRKSRANGVPEDCGKGGLSGMSGGSRQREINNLRVFNLRRHLGIFRPPPPAP